MSIFSRALAGAAEGVSSIAGKYLDQQLQQDRMRTMEELRMMSEQKMDEYRNSPERRERLRTEDLKDSQVKHDQTVAQEIADARNPDLISSKIDSANRFTEGTAPSKAAAEGVIAEAKGRSTPQVLAPGQVLTIGGKVIGENTRPTPAEVSWRAYHEGLKGSGALDKMSQAGKVQLDNLERRANELQKTIDAGVANGSLSPSENGADGKPSQGFASYKYLLNQQQTIAMQRMRLLASEGVVDGGEDAKSLVDGGATGPELEASLAQAAKVGGRYGAAFKATIEPVLRQMRGTPNKMAAIQADAAATGTTDYLTDINGVQGQVGNTIWAKSASQPKKAAKQEAPEVIEVRKAEDKVREARAAFDSFGSRQRQSDPRGFERARQALEAAKADLRDAVDRMNGSPDAAAASLPTFRGPNP